MSVSRLLNKTSLNLFERNFKQISYLKCSPILRANIDCIRNTNRCLSYVVINRSLLLNANTIELWFIQRRQFKQRQQFSHQKGWKIDTFGTKIYSAMIFCILGSLVFNVENIWENYVPDYITDPIELGCKKALKMWRKF